jgi:L-2-hydroxyglutarate oxidase LhgO
MDQVDAVVVGAGAVGLAVARALAQRGLDTVVLERERAIGTGVSSRNSEVIHAGLYYAPGSLKARLCVEGRQRLYDFCRSHGVAHQRLGKLVVATSADQVAGLDALVAKARGNGVRDVCRLSADEARAMEPELACHGAMWSPSTGIVDAQGLMRALHGDLEAAGGAVAVSSPVLAVELGEASHVVHVGGDEPMALRTRMLVNAAGLGAVPLAAQMQGLDARHVPRAFRCKGSYFALAGASPFKRLIYPMPQDAWLGVHLTLDLGGQARFGPDVEWLGEDDGSPIDYQVDAGRAEAFYADVRRYWPGLPDGALVPAYSGMRPKIHGPYEAAPDFLLQGLADHGVPGLLNAFGIESPGLTSCLALADEVLLRLGLGAGL